MEEQILIGKERGIVTIPREAWEQGLAGRVPLIKARLDFMSDSHHLVRNFAVKELPQTGEALSPEFISQRLDLPLARVNFILEDLEKNLTFLYRNKQGWVAWAYPVTAHETPHKVSFSSGERINAAWAIDTMATPFVQGRLREAPVSCTIRTECGHCRRPIVFELDSELNHSIPEGPGDPLVFLPFVDPPQLKDPSIIDAFWRKSIFFWSEEHAREYRRQTDQMEGAFYTLEQAAFHTRLLQSALFTFR